MAKRKVKVAGPSAAKRRSQRRFQFNYNYLIIAVLVLAFVGILWTASAPGPALAGGKPVPDFTLRDLSGNLVSLSDFRGKPVLLNVWASWCPSCRGEMSDLEAFYNEYSSQGVVVVGVNASEDRGTVASYVSRQGLTFPVLLDTDGKVGNMYRVDGLPASFFIDKDGILRAMRVGAIAKRDMIQLMSRLIQL
ncbi:MAG: TlpA family protein disulfide reductase [Chloroflexi bacterium]|nr:TlpA family protein disulfide reductase [Chloroflexota bacterium]